jgi:methyltransferase family protein
VSESAVSRAREQSPAPALRNVYACLVHESQECVIDLVRNLRCLDPDSLVLLYNGSTDSRLLEPISCFDKLGAHVHPEPHPVDMRTLHEFALACMRYAGERLPFDTLTIVDSDQLGLRAGWSSLLAGHLAGKSRVGLLGGGVGGAPPERQPKTTRVTPAIGAWQELPLWRPLLARFPNGEAQFPRWAAWPGMVFTADAARALTSWFEEDAELRRIVGDSRMWAKEQIMFPTLTALLGFRVLPSPTSQDYIKYQVTYDPSEAQAALADERAYWIHPVARRYDDASRSVVRGRFNQYRHLSGARSAAIAKTSIVPVGDELRQPILREMKNIEGWLTPSEADLLISTTHRALTDCPHVGALVEVGSYCGRATSVIGSVVRAVRPTARLWAIDPHDGFVGAHDQGLERVAPTLERLRGNVERLLLSPFVELVQGRAQDVPWSEPLSFLMIDGLHDYPNVLKDFSHFEPHLCDGALVAFHDYAEYFPGVPAFVDELCASGRYQAVARARSLIVLRKLPGSPTAALPPGSVRSS